MYSKVAMAAAVGLESYGRPNTVSGQQAGPDGEPL